jgi:hypothetical protein
MKTGETANATSAQRAAGTGRSRRARPPKAAAATSMNTSETSRPRNACSPNTRYVAAESHGISGSSDST